METAVNEITLVVFTTLAPAGVLGLLFVAMAIFFSSNEDHAHRLSHFLVIPLALAVVGLVASATHLGTPANALYVMTGVGRSPLSNEVIAVVAFFALAGIYWIASFRDEPLGVPARAWLVVTFASGLVSIWFISIAYTVPTIPTWSLPQAQASLWLDGLSAAPAIVVLTMICAQVYPAKKTLAIFAAITGVAALANTAVLLSESAALDALKTTTTTASDLVPGYTAAVAAYLALELAVVALLVLPVLRPAFQSSSKLQRRRYIFLGILTSTLACTASFIIRFYFYSMYMTVGI